MKRLLLRRARHGALVLLGVSVLSFVFVELAPGDPFDEIAIRHPELAETLRDRYGLDASLPERYARWVLSVLRGELGYSFSKGSPVAPLLAPRVGNTLLLTLPAMLIAWGLALPLGTLWAAARGRAVDRAAGLATSALLSVPGLVLVLGMLALAVTTGALPAGDMRSSGWDRLGPPARLLDLGRHMLLPVTALVLAMLPVLMRHVHSAVASVLAQPWVLAARGQGIPRGRLLFRLVLPAAANPLVSLFGLSVAGLLSGSVVVEHVMSWPGLGELALEAIRARDVHLVLAPVLASTLLLLLGNLVADALLLLVDPRIRGEARG